MSAKSLNFAVAHAAALLLPGAVGRGAEDAKATVFYGMLGGTGQ